jgi:hypothetical protein
MLVIGLKPERRPRWNRLDSRRKAGLWTSEYFPRVSRVRYDVERPNGTDNWLFLHLEAMRNRSLGSDKISASTCRPKYSTPVFS